MMFLSMPDIGDDAHRKSAKNARSVDDDIANSVEYFKRRGLPWVDISRKQLLSLPPSVQSFNTLQYLNMNTNNFCSLPETFFESFPLLTWFDIRFNQLTSLPTAGLSVHSRLQTILLQGNKLTTLPLELGLIKPLRDIQFAGNPLEFPSTDLLSQGTTVIKDFLAAVLHTNGRIPNVVNGDNSDSLDDTAGFEERFVHGSNGTNDELVPAVRKKFSSSLSHASSVVPGDEPARRKGSKTSGSIVNFGVNAAVAAPTKLQSAELLYLKAKEQNALEQRKKKLIKIDKILQHRRDVQTLDDWRDEAKELQHRKDMEKRLNGGKLDFKEPARAAPFGIADGEMRMKNDAERRRAHSPPAQKPKPLSPEAVEKIEKAQAEKDFELTVMIKDHMNRVVSRSRVVNNERTSDTTTAQEDLSLAKRELEMAQRLQQEVSRRRKEMEFRMNSLQQKIAAGPKIDQNIAAKH